MVYPHIIPDIHEWPISKFDAIRQSFIDELNAFVLNKLETSHHNSFEDLLAKTIYLESQRAKNIPWKVDPQDDLIYWRTMGQELNEALSASNKNEALRNLVKRIINRYNEEIVGNFKPKTYKFARRFLTLLFKVIFNKFKDKGQGFFWGKRKDLVKNIQFSGYVDEVRDLFKKGTVVIVPTHFSNLDSIMIGAAVDFVAGLPAFAYGAGLNLYDVEIAAYFMNRLGAYRVDRRKKNPIYLECLTSMVSYSLFKGVNNIFFPGGTRSRSGAIEDKLKLGLLGSVVDAQRLHIENGSKEKIFLVPLVVSYHFVFEAGGLIEQHLQLIGKEKYSRTKQSGGAKMSKWDFVKSLFSKKSEVIMSFGEPLDALGNKVDSAGNSIDKHNNPIDISEYFILDGKITENSQRENVYTKMIGDKIVQSFRVNNVVLSSHLVAFIAFQYLLRQRKDLNFFAILRLHSKEFALRLDVFKSLLSRAAEKLKEMEHNGLLRLSEQIHLPIDQLIEDGIYYLGTYHSESVLRIQNDFVLTDNIKLLYYYSNRLEGYDLEEKIEWDTIEEFKYLDKLEFD